MYILILSLSSKDVPFKNGKYTHGEDSTWPAFNFLSRSSIQSDSSLFLIIHFIHSLYKSKTTNIILLKEIRITLHLILFLLQYTQSSPHSITISKKSKSPSFTLLNHSISLPSFLTHTNLPLSCRN